MDAALIRRIVEAALLASPQPLSLNQLTALFPEDAPPPPGSLEQALTELGEQNGQRGVSLIEVASGFRFQVDAELQPWVSRLWAERPPRYSRALLETLALIAYRQPITRGEIEQIRGVAVSTHIIKTLEEREWIRVVGHRDVPGRPALFGTTRGFLDYFGLKSLEDLPALTELQDLPDLEPELPLEGIVVAEARAAAQSTDADSTAHAGSDAEASAGEAEAESDAEAAEAVESAGADEAGAADGEEAESEAATGDSPAGNTETGSDTDFDSGTEDGDNQAVADTDVEHDNEHTYPASIDDTDRPQAEPFKVEADLAAKAAFDESTETQAGDSAEPEHKA
ncbi:SMC-Scp complex subunit ScpB [Pseudomarimonas salicorniae]|uniref:SMC-Scp complex subunit ScpB n=1 Tax=Pseudomarimonas salicorniae TaxID=2933270 RepID=A0ABT0GKZ3_9GAMM|nr:SMC-Scp complex subunit ScpB [Lysobacter sp. CAU 1642]MCK7595207.1 SMC-Scp complex subunit ScpB [Lysobacter sp. CAU 1642]